MSSITKNIVIEARQANGTTVAPGQFSVVLAKEVVLEEGDVLQLSKSFIDTKDQNNIIIQKDLTVSMSVGVYITDWQSAFGRATTYSPRQQVNIAGQTLEPMTDSSCEYMIPYRQNAVPNEPNLEMRTFQNYSVSATSKNTLQYLTTVYEYKDSTGTKQIVHGLIAIEPGVNVNYKLRQDMFMTQKSIICQVGSFTCLTPVPPQWTSLSYLDTPGQPVQSGYYSPWTFPVVFKIPAGQYSPVQMADFISETMGSFRINQNDQYTNNQPYYSPLLWKLSDFDLNGTLGCPYQTLFANIDAGVSFKTSATGSKDFIGSTQFEMTFRADGKFEITWAHMPLYDIATGKDMTCIWQHPQRSDKANPSGDPTKAARCCRSHSGMFFTGISTVDSDGTPVAFFDGVLGFDLQKLCVQGTNQVLNPFGTSGYWQNCSLIEGQNITCAYAGLDSTVLHVEAWYQEGSTLVNQPNGQIESTVSSNTTIIADRSQAQLNTTSSHFIVEANIGLQDMITSEVVSHNTVGIVGRYQSYDTYTYSPDASIIYQHRGAPVALRNINIRISDPDRKPIQSLGPDNTMFFQLSKTVMTAPPGPPPRAH